MPLHCGCAVRVQEAAHAFPGMLEARALQRLERSRVVLACARQRTVQADHAVAPDLAVHEQRGMAAQGAHQHRAAGARGAGDHETDGRLRHRPGLRGNKDGRQG
jgi:hypothetical protein